MSGQRKKRAARRKANRVIGTQVCAVWREVARQGRWSAGGTLTHSWVSDSPVPGWSEDAPSLTDGWVVVGTAAVADDYGPPTLVVDVDSVLGAATVDLPHAIAPHTISTREQATAWFWRVMHWDEHYAPGVLPVLGRVENGELAAISGWNLVGEGERVARRAAGLLGVAFESDDETEQA